MNYSSLRAGLLEFRRWIEILRWHVFIPMFCNQVWRRFIDRAYVAGVINRQDYGVVWSAPKFEMIDPLKDAQADTLMMRNGTLTLREAIAPPKALILRSRFRKSQRYSRSSMT